MERWKKSLGDTAGDPSKIAELCNWQYLIKQNSFVSPLMENISQSTDAASFVGLKHMLNRTAVSFPYPRQWGAVVAPTVKNGHNY